MPRFYAGEEKPFKHAVPALHGYSGSPQEYDALTKQLKENGIPIYAPLMTGFGLNDYRLLKEIRYSDWLRDAYNTFTKVDTLSEKVSIVAQSTGAHLALYIVKLHEVGNLVLVGPDFVPSDEDNKMKQLTNIPVLKQVFY